MAPSSSICVSFFLHFDESANATDDDRKSRNKRIGREALKQKHCKLAKAAHLCHLTRRHRLRLRQQG